jgi:hypothetical protein
MTKLDDLLSSISNGQPGADPGLEKMRAALFAELEVAPKRSWRGDVLLVVGTCWLAFLAAAAALVFSGQVQAAHLLARAVPLSMLAGVVAVAGFAALAPRNRTQLLVGYLVAAVGLIGLVLLRGEGHPSTTAPWVCTVSHAAFGAGPLVLMLSLLRKSALGAARTALAGLAIGATGAMLGELSCEQGWAHVAVWHLGAWLGLAAASLLVSRRLVPRSYAP